jgi:hypothetical protein
MVVLYHHAQLCVTASTVAHAVGSPSRLNAVGSWTSPMGAYSSSSVLIVMGKKR